MHLFPFKTNVSTYKCRDTMKKMKKTDEKNTLKEKLKKKISESGRGHTTSELIMIRFLFIWYLYFTPPFPFPPHTPSFIVLCLSLY